MVGTVGDSSNRPLDVLYVSRKAAVDNEERDDDHELWGVHAPEGVALLSFGLLLQLVGSGSSNSGADDEFLTELSKWGQTCTSMANDDCAVFAYLERALSGVAVNPLDGVCDRLPTRLGNQAEVGRKLYACWRGGEKSQCWQIAIPWL